VKREREIRRVLERVRANCDIEARRAADPVGFVHAVEGPLARELVGLLASAMAFGNVKAMKPKIADALKRLGPDILKTTEDARLVGRRMLGWKHRVYTGRDVAGLMVGARRLQLADGSLGAALVHELSKTGDLRSALSAWTARLRREGRLGRDRPGARHILADPAAGSAAKRLMLFLRWMIRPADGVDLGQWDVPASALIVPVDTLIHKLGRNLGFTNRQTVSWQAAAEITAALARLDPEDPVKYDFALCHMGMLQSCPSRRDPERCAGCGIQSVCRHWAE